MKRERLRRGMRKRRGKGGEEGTMMERCCNISALSVHCLGRFLLSVI